MYLKIILTWVLEKSLIFGLKEDITVVFKINNIKEENVMKKIIALLTITLLSMGMLVGCGSSSKETSKDTITLAVWGSSPAEVSALDKTIESFTADTGIKVEKEVIQDKYMDVMKARFAADNAPDVFYIDSFELPALAESGVLKDQSDTIKDSSDFYEPMINAFKGKDGKIYGVPKDYSTLALYVNTDLLNKAGYKSSDIPTDMNGFFEFTKELKGKLPKGIAPMIIEKDLARHLDEFNALDVDVINENGEAQFANSKLEDYLQKYVDGKKDGSLSFAKDDLGSDSAIAAFGSGKTAMMIEGNWALGAFAQDFKDLKFETLQLPKLDKKDHTMAFTVGYGINNKTKNLENAEQFVEYMTGEKGQEIWCEGSGVLPTRKSVADKMKLENNPLKKAHVEGASYATVWSDGVTLPVINTAFGNNFSAAMNGQVDVKTAMNNLDKEANDEIKRQQ